MMPGNAWSLRRRIYAVAAAAILSAWVAGGLALFSSAQREYERMCHQNLANLALTVLTFSEHELREITQDNGGAHVASPVHAETVATLSKRFAYQIWSGDGTLLLRSFHAPEHERLAPVGALGFSEQEIDGRLRYVYALRSPANDMEIQVSDDDGDGLFVSPEFVRDMLLAFVLALGPVLFVTWRLIRNAFAAMVAMADELVLRGATELSPLTVPSPPRELIPVIGAVNGLLEVVGRALDRERSFTALAAHEMRTPLASMRMQTQVVARATDPQERSRSVLVLMENVDRCARLLTQLLALARADAHSRGGVSCEPVRVDEACAEVLTDFVELAERRQISLQCELAVQEVAADKVALETLLRNLVSNALRYTPDSGAVRVATVREGGCVLLSVDDSGPGIPAVEHERVLHRFYRGTAHKGVGAGLGLAIVASIVDAHRAAMTLGVSSFGGLRVEVRFASA